jgi:hypothetical protein
MIVLGFLPNLGMAELVVVGVFAIVITVSAVITLIWLVFKFGGLADALADKKKVVAENARLRAELARLKEVKQ